MIEYHELVERVAEDDEVDDAHEAGAVVQAVLTVLAPRLDRDVWEGLREDVPWAWAAQEETGGDEDITGEFGDLTGRVALRLGCPPDEGLRLTRAVLTQITSLAPEWSRDLADQLPARFVSWSPGPSGAADASDAGAGG